MFVSPWYLRRFSIIFTVKVLKSVICSSMETHLNGYFWRMCLGLTNSRMCVYVWNFSIPYFNVDFLALKGVPSKVYSLKCGRLHSKHLVLYIISLCKYFRNASTIAKSEPIEPTTLTHQSKQTRSNRNFTQVP